MKKICVVTGTRAEYGILKPLIQKLLLEPQFDTRIAVTGMHLSDQFGYTCQEIEKDGIPIDRKIPILTEEDSSIGISKTLAAAIEGFAEYFHNSPPDLLVILGDRYEMMGVALAAMNEHIPIAHLHGGETTEGAIDEGIRHSITKLSHLHFTSTKEHRKRVIQLGEAPDRVFYVGALGVENVLHTELYGYEELCQELGLEKGRPYALVTYHPVTLEDHLENENHSLEALKQLLEALEEFPDMQYVITKANADAGGARINAYLEQYVSINNQMIHNPINNHPINNHPVSNNPIMNNRIRLFSSLGMKRYLSAVKYSAFVVGNSSSGIIEVPSFHVPTVDIGIRQKGRMCAASVLHCSETKEAIAETIRKVREPQFLDLCKKIENPYGNGDTSTQIVAIIKQKLLEGSIDLKKKFYDIDFS